MQVLSTVRHRLLRQTVSPDTHTRTDCVLNYATTVILHILPYSYSLNTLTIDVVQFGVLSVSLDLYSLPNIVRVVKSRRMRWAGHVARMGEDRGVDRVLVGKPDGKRPLGRPGLRWEDNIKMDHQEVGGGHGD
jgi:hypothetical protein